MKEPCLLQSKDMKPTPSSSFCQRWQTALVTKVIRKMKRSDSTMVMGNKYSKRVPGRHYHTPASPMEHLGIRWLNSHSTGATKTML